MDQAVNQLLSWGSLYLALSVVIFTFLVRRVVETAVPTAKKDHKPETGFGRWWNGVILYAIPVLSGSGLALAETAMGWGWLAPQSLGGAFLYGGIVGWFSGFLYKVFRKTLKARTGIDPVPGPASVVPSDPEPEVDEEPAKAEAEDEEPEKDDEAKED